MFVFTSRFQKWFLPFFFDFQGQGQRSKVTALEYLGPIIMSLFLLVFSVKRSPKPGYIESRYITAILMQLSNDLDLPTGKVKVI